MLLIFAEIHTIDIFFLEVCRDSDQTVSLLQPYFDTDSIFAKSHLRGEGGKESECQRKLSGAEHAKVLVRRKPVEETTPSRRWRTAPINVFLRRNIRLGRPTALPPDVRRIVAGNCREEGGDDGAEGQRVTGLCAKRSNIQAVM